MDLRPREERDFTDFYTGLDETALLDAFIVASTDLGPLHPVHENSTKTSGGGPPKLCTLNTVLKNFSGISKDAGRVSSPGKISRSIAAYGYRTSTRPSRKNSACYARFAPAVPSQLLLMYDMDEQDILYLDWLNLQQGAIKLSPEVFEIAVSVLESEWHKLEMRMIALVGPGHDGRDDLKMDANFEKYGSDDGTGGVDSLSEQRCAVCNDLECDNTNSIVYCDGCNVAVHQECYGVAFIPEGLWFCRRCMVNRGSSVSCTFCPSKTGAFKQLDNGMWSHVVCALWIREVYFANPVYLEPIEGVASIPRSRWTLVCYICKQKTGACIQCVNRKCTQAYHVTCAKRAGLYMAMDKGVLGAIASNDTLKSFCDRHSPPHIDKEIALTGILRTRLFYKDAHSLSRRNDRLASERRLANRINRFKWKTENGTPIAPQLFVDVLVATMKSLKVGMNGPDRVLRGLIPNMDKNKDREGDITAVSAALCRYWCLKREAKKGAPLVRIRASEQVIATSEPVHLESLLIPENADHNQVGDKEEGTQMPEKLEFGYSLDTDLQKLIHLNSMVVERQKLISSRDDMLFKMADTAYFAFKTMALQVLLKMSHILQRHQETKQEVNGLDVPDFEQIMFKVSEGMIWTASDVDREIKQFFDERRYTYTPVSVAKAVRYWNETGLQEVSSVENSASESIPFSDIDGMKFSLKQYDPKAILDAENLSEIEDDPFTQFSNREVLRKLVSK